MRIATLFMSVLLGITGCKTAGGNDVAQLAATPEEAVLHFEMFMTNDAESLQAQLFENLRQAAERNPTIGRIPGGFRLVTPHNDEALDCVARSSEGFLAVMSYSCTFRVLAWPKLSPAMGQALVASGVVPESLVVEGNEQRLDCRDKVYGKAKYPIVCSLSDTFPAGTAPVTAP